MRDTSAVFCVGDESLCRLLMVATRCLDDDEILMLFYIIIIIIIIMKRLNQIINTGLPLC